jgi:DNA-binding FadR family transcriptional regulator
MLGQRQDAQRGGDPIKKPLREPALNETIRNYIKRYIIAQGLSAGDALPPEGQWAEELGVGRSSIREAIKALQSLGIVEVRHGDGLYVREYNFDPIYETVRYGARFERSSVLELAQLRVWLETASVVDVANNIDSEGIAALEEVIRDWEEGSRGGQADLGFHLESERQFHHALYTPLGNRTLMILLDVFWTALGDYLLNYRSEPEVDLADHVAILSALQAHDPILAQQAVLRHLLRIQDRVRVAMDSMLSMNNHS